MYDLIVIGGGAAGFAAATRANDLGASALMVSPDGHQALGLRRGAALRGAVKLTIDRENRIRGAYACGTNAAAIIHEATLAIRLGLTTQDIIDTIHVFPTYSEAIKLAA